jgi:PAS domain S-box-containing protein
MHQLEPWLYQRIVDDAPEAILVADPEGTIVFWNAAAEVMFGYAAADAVGRSLDLIIPEAQRARHWDGYRRVMQTGLSRYTSDVLAVPALCADGRRISLEFHVVLLRAGDDGVTGIAAIIRDVTERWQQDRALRQRLQTLEAEHR